MTNPAANPAISKLTIAVVGAGGACVAFLHHLVAAIDLATAARLRIVVFEPRERAGPGMAYQADVKTALLNRNAATMSASASNFSTFSAWLRWKAHHDEELNQLSNAELADTYMPRALFGRFLTDFFLETCASARKKGLEIELVRCAVSAIARGHDYQLRYGDALLRADAVLLATGNTEPRDHYNLAGHARFVASPYPLRRRLPTLAPSGALCIVGTGLTAVDIAVTLEAQGYRGAIDMVSPGGHLPHVRGRHGQPHRLRHFTGAAVAQLTRGATQTCSLRALTRLLRAELRTVGYNWRALFAAGDGALPRLRKEIAGAEQEQGWQAVLSATNEVIELAWRALSRPDQRLVTQRYARSWLARRAPMPASNARMLLGMIEAGRLRLLAETPAFDSSQPDAIVATYPRCGERRRYDFVINATGAAKWVEAPNDAPLIWQLLQAGYAVNHEFGGIRVDAASGALIDTAGKADRNLRVLGHLTGGTYFFVSSLEIIAKHARRIADDMLATLVMPHQSMGAAVAPARRYG